MNIRIGDIVRFISEKMEGKVTGIIDNTTVNIFVDDRANASNFLPFNI